MITIVTAAWKRPKRFELCLRNWTNLDPKPIIAVCGSPDDPETARLAKEYGCLYFEIDNLPLGRKHNHGIESAARQVGEGYFLIEGSDDLISQKMWDYYNRFEGEYLAIRDFYAYNIPDRRYIHWQGFTDKRRENEPIGSGKLIRYDVLEKAGFRPFNDKKNRGLDGAVHASIMKTGAECTLIRLSDTGGINISMKTQQDGGNLNKFKLWNNAKYIQLRHIQSDHPDIWELIQSFHEAAVFN